MKSQKASKAKTPTRTKAAKKQSVSQRFDLESLESLRLTLVDRQGGEVVIELQREMEEKPQLHISTSFTETGDLKSAFTIYELDA